MRSAAVSAEAARVQQTAQVALAIIAARAFVEAGRLWAQAMRSTSSPAVGADRWINQSLRVMRVWRRQALEVTVSSHALQRALRTGEALHMPGDDRTPRVSLNRLRGKFEASVRDYAPSAFDAERGLIDAEVTPTTPIGQLLEIAGLELPERRYEPWASGGRDASLPTASVSGLEAALRKSEAEWEREARRTLAEAAKENLQQAKAAEVKLTKGEPTLSEADKARGKDLDTAARKAGTAAAYNVQSSSRDATQQIGRRDRRVHAWIRVHYPKDGRGPCAFCAMMLSRGAVYTSQESAGGAIGGPNSFHPNCRCQAVPVYQGEFWREMPEYTTNVYYEKLWQKVYPNTGSSEARFNTWRRVIDAANRSHVRSGTLAAEKKVSEA